MSTTVRVQVQSDHLARLASARSPAAAIGELIWNSLDADATDVRVTIKRNLLGGIEKISIVDNGSGMDREGTLEAFRDLGGSRKRTAPRSPAGRFYHGRLGKGRFKGFALGTEVEWRTTYRDAGKLKSYTISGSKENLSSFTFSDSENAGGSKTGTEVVVTGIESVPKSLENDRAVEELTGEFALYLRQYPNVKLAYNGLRIDAAKKVLCTEDLPLPAFEAEGGSLIEATATVIEWSIPVERALYLCDAEGLTLSRVPVAVHAPGFNFTAYVRSAAIRTAEENGSLQIDGLSPELTILIDNAKRAVKGYFRGREAEQAASLVQEWKREAIYPYAEEPVTPIQQAERQVFDVVALNVHSYVPDFETTDTTSKRLTFQLIRQALETDASALQRILKDVLRSPPRKTGGTGPTS